MNNDDFIKKIYLQGELINDMTKDGRKKIILIIFGNESRGISELVRKISHHKVIIPQYGFPDTSYNISVSCGMILYHLYNINILPGCFMDFSDVKGLKCIANKLIDNFKNINRGQLNKLKLEDILKDL